MFLVLYIFFPLLPFSNNILAQCHCWRSMTITLTGFPVVHVRNGIKEVFPQLNLESVMDHLWYIELVYWQLLVLPCGHALAMWLGSSSHKSSVYFPLLGHISKCDAYRSLKGTCVVGWPSCTLSLGKHPSTPGSCFLYSGSQSEKHRSSLSWPTRTELFCWPQPESAAPWLPHRHMSE